MKRILILNGPNLNVIHLRDSRFYPSQSFDVILQWLRESFPYLELVYFQTNHEGVLLDKIHQVLHEPIDGLIINPGGLAHTSVVLRDALEIVKVPKVEVHLSQIFARESFRHHSYISEVCDATITGCGKYSYYLALVFLQEILRNGD